jgi:ketosteroid isomerase-like protein
MNVGATRETVSSKAKETGMEDQGNRAALDRHWAASEAGDDDVEHEIYHDDAVLEYPQSGERIRGRDAIRTTRGLLPNKHFAIRRVLGRGDFWVTEYVITYDEKASYTVSIMEFRDGKVFRETQYFGDPFEPWSGRARWVEPINE